MAQITLRDVYKTYGDVFAVDHVSLVARMASSSPSSARPAAARPPPSTSLPA